LKYLLDTCVISELVRKSPEPKVVNWINRNDEGDFYLSVLTLGEIQKGISRLTDKKRRESFQHWLDTDLKERFSGRILPVSKDVALSWGVILGEAEAKGKTVPAIDGLLAATAIAHNLTLVTRNIKDVSPTGVRYINPWDA
jgi:predicted nucleic acid-binding protein